MREPVAGVDPGLDLFERFGMDGDDCDDFIISFGRAFEVNLSGYLWYFHHGEEPHWGVVFQLFWRAPNDRVTRIPVSPQVLQSSANTGTWAIEYPPHSLPKRRYDVVACWVFMLALLALLGLRFLPR